VSIASGISKGLGYVLPGYGQEGAPAGVAGPASAGQPVVYDPGTGLYVNQATGAVSTDPGGQNPVSDPSLATQAARNLATSQQFLSSLGQYGQQYSGAQAAESSLAGKLNATIAGTAPSVARSQLEQWLSQIVQQQQSQASGATGEAGAASRVAAMNNTANAQAATNSQDALLRANEVTGAETALGSLDANQAGQALTASGQAQTSAGNFSNLAGNQEQNNDTLTQSGAKNQLTTVGTLASSGGSALGIPGGGSGLSNLGGEAAPTTSDMNEKTNVKGADMEDFLSKISAATGGKGGIEYDYKDPSKPGQSEGRKVGVPAQAVAKSKVGKKIVKADDEGTLKMGHGEMLGAIIGALAHLNNKVNARG
jgi:hypothetical protein